MRRIGNVENEKQAFAFYSFLMKEGIHATYEKKVDQETKKETVAIWIYEEDQIERACAFLEEFKQNPNAEKFAKVEFPKAPPQPPDHIAENKETKAKQNGGEDEKPRRMRKIRSYPFTYFIIFLCAVLYFWSGAQQLNMFKADGKLALEIGMTPVQQKLMIDYPQSNQKIDELLQKYDLKTKEDLKALPPSELQAFKEAEEIPTWRGALQLVLDALNKKSAAKDKGPILEKVGQGEFWRLFTPIFLHGGLLHILFNMLWAWLLLKQVEERLPIWKILVLILTIGIISNLAQYFVSGPYFLGFSGVVCGLVGFIWMRQKLAPWEGYPLQKSTIIFILVFVLAMFALEVFSLVTAVLSAKQLSANIANTAHIVGGLVGILLGRVSFFARGRK